MNLHTPNDIKFIEFPPLSSSDSDFCTNRFCFNMQTMKFKIDSKQIQELIEQGYACASRELNTKPKPVELLWSHQQIDSSSDSPQDWFLCRRDLWWK